MCIFCASLVRHLGNILYVLVQTFHAYNRPSNDNVYMLPNMVRNQVYQSFIWNGDILLN